MRLFTFPFNISIFDCSETTSTFREDRQCLQKSCSAEQSVFEARKTLTCLQAIQQKNELQHRKNNNNDEKTRQVHDFLNISSRYSVVACHLSSCCQFCNQQFMHFPLKAHHNGRHCRSRR